MNEKILYFVSKKQRGFSQPIESIGKGLSKYSKHDIEVEYLDPRPDKNELERIAEKYKVIISYRGDFFENVVKLNKELKFIHLINTISKNMIRYDDNPKVNTIQISKYGLYWYKHHFGKGGSLLGIGVDLDLFPYKKKINHNIPIFGMVYNKGVKHRKGIEILEKIKNLGYEVKEAVGDIFSSPQYPYDEIYKFYQNIDCLIFNSPNIEGKEAGGIPIIEAGACGTPVISTSVGFACETINEDNGYIVENSKDILKICSSFKNNSELIEKGEKYCKFIRKNYSWKVIVERWDDFIDNLIVEG